MRKRERPCLQLRSRDESSKEFRSQGLYIFRASRKKAQGNIYNHKPT